MQKLRCVMEWGADSVFLEFGTRNGCAQEPLTSGTASPV
jgi:hypothetical protein